MQIGKSREDGLREGEIKKARQIAKGLLDILDGHTIAHKTGLSVEDIKKLPEQ